MASSDHQFSNVPIFVKIPLHGWGLLLAAYFTLITTHQPDMDYPYIRK